MNANPTKVLIYGDLAIPSGFGRIGAAVGQYLHAHGYAVMGACVQYDGILPPPTPLPFHVCGLNGRDRGQWVGGFAQTVRDIVGAYKPDVLVSVQDFPYHEALRAVGIDFSVLAHVVITPVDGVPVNKNWLNVAAQFDSFMSISEFGVAAFRAGGRRAELCAPGVDTGEFFRMGDAERADIRARLNIPAGAFVVGAMAMNQGRKDFPSMVRGFADAFRDCPDAFLYLDCEKVSPAGWDIPAWLVEQNKLDLARVRFREDAGRGGVFTLNARYNLLDLHMVIAKREGFGLPHIEALATGIPTVSSDYCSGPEIVGANERGWLIPSKPNDYGTWGGALDYDVDRAALSAALREAYDKPAERKARGEAGLAWVRAERTWARAGAAVEAEIARVVALRGADLARKVPQPPAPAAPPVQVMGAVA